MGWDRNNPQIEYSMINFENKVTGLGNSFWSKLWFTFLLLSWFKFRNNVIFLFHIDDCFCLLWTGDCQRSLLGQETVSDEKASLEMIKIIMMDWNDWLIKMNHAYSLNTSEDYKWSHWWQRLCFKKNSNQNCKDLKQHTQKDEVCKCVLHLPTRTSFAISFTLFFLKFAIWQ